VLEKIVLKLGKNEYAQYLQHIAEIE